MDFLDSWQLVFVINSKSMSRIRTKNIQKRSVQKQDKFQQQLAEVISLNTSMLYVQILLWFREGLKKVIFITFQVGGSAGANYHFFSLSDMLRGLANMLHSSVNTATYTAFISFLADFEKKFKCFQLFQLEKNIFITFLGRGGGQTPK